MKIVSVVGARPQFIKLAMISKQIDENTEHLVVHTGQHYDWELSGKFFIDFKLPAPTINLGIGSGSHAYQTAAMLTPLENFLRLHNPDWVLNYGDTNTTLSTSIVTSKLGLKCAHLEAGLRSGNRQMPEEINRIVSDHLSNLNLAPSENAIKNLKHEGLGERSILVGDIMVDALKFASNMKKGTNELNKQIVKERDYLIATFHREELTSSRSKLASLFLNLSNLSIKVYLAAHPRLMETIRKYELNEFIRNSLELVPPMGYFEMLETISHSKGVITDSGGLQKEAYLLKVPCVTVRRETEWPETLEGNWNRLLWHNLDNLRNSFERTDEGVHNPLVYGDGTTSVRVMEELKVRM